MVQADAGLSASTTAARAITAESDTRSTSSTSFVEHSGAGGTFPTRRNRKEILNYGLSQVYRQLEPTVGNLREGGAAPRDTPEDGTKISAALASTTHAIPLWDDNGTS